MSIRWMKLWRDLVAERARYGLMLLAVAVSLTAFGAVLGVRDVLQREMARNYLGTRPAHATLELPQGVSVALLDRVRQRQDIELAEAGDVIQARALVKNEWLPLLLFVVDDFKSFQLNRFTPAEGSFPPPAGQLLIERSAVGVLGAGVGDRVTLKLPGGSPVDLPVAGLVHDPSLAPAWQERSGYAYASRQTLASLGVPAVHELRVRFKNVAETMPAIQSAAESLAAALSAVGASVSEVRVPPPRRHPHQTQMETVLLLLLIFSALSLILSGILTATALNALLARQMREIAVMKTLGARTGQLAVMYGGLVAALGLAGLLIAGPLAALALRPFARGVALLLNLQLDGLQPAAWVFAVQALAALTVPLAIACVPIWQACRITIRQAMDNHGVGSTSLRRASANWPMAWRNLVRRPTRLILTLGLLMAGGAMFMTALNVSSSWDRTIDKVYATRHYDIEIRTAGAMPADAVARASSLPGVRAVEAWGHVDAAFARAGHIDVSHAYPDRGHGTMSLMAPPRGSRMVSFPVLSGHWLAEGDPAHAVVLNHAAARQSGGAKVGDSILLSLGGVTSQWTLVGIVEEVGASGVAYVSTQGLAMLAPSAAGARILRIASDAANAEQRAKHIQALDRTLSDWGLTVQSARPLSELRTAMGDHIQILIRALISLAAVMAIVGGLGLASVTSINVLERTRELAVMKTLGATPARLVRMVLQEARWLALSSWLLAWMASLPLTWFLNDWIGQLGFVAPLPFTVSAMAAGAWLLMAVALAWLAARIPAASAGNTPIAIALQQV